MLEAWRDLVCVVAPVCHGKSTMVQRFGGLDADALIADTGLDREGDAEWAVYCDHLSDGRSQPTESQLRVQNDIRLRRLRRFFSLVEPDSNAKVLYLHTYEAAHLLGFKVILGVHLHQESLLHTKRFQNLEAPERLAYYESIRRQQSANISYSQMHDLIEPQMFWGYEQAARVVESVVRRHANLRESFWEQYLLPAPGTHEMLRTLYSNCVSVLRSANYTPAEKAIAARALYEQDGASAITDAHQHHNHEYWADWVHRTRTPAWHAAARRLQNDDWMPPASEDDVVERFPYAAGNSRFAVCKIYDWLKYDRVAYDKSYWSTQLLMTQGSGTGYDSCSYERLLATCMFDKLMFGAHPNVHARWRRLALGLLPTREFANLGSECHNLVRVTGTLLGYVYADDEVGVVTYINSLAGRSPADVDIAIEAKAREQLYAPKKYYDVQSQQWSEELFDVKLRDALKSTLAESAAILPTRILEMAEWATDFDAFMEHRKSWVKPGSATGAPKADIYLRATTDVRDQLEGVAEEVARATNMVLMRIKNLRLNKAAVFEFPEFTQIVRDALKDYIPNSFTRYFTKKEVGREKPRSLFPSTLLHYVVNSFLLTLVEKGGPMKGTRQQASADQQRVDHWLWHETSEYTLALMVDYASFNEQHMNKHMVELLNATTSWYDHFGILTADMRAARDWLAEAMQHIDLEADGQLYHFAHGLLSGWRMTSFANSHLNNAYLKVIKSQVHELFGETVLVDYQSGGDDVMSLETSLWHAHLMLAVGGEMGFEFKAIKQMISYKHREFFRLFVNSTGVYGSVCRVLGSAASGQWSNSVVGKLIEPATKLSSVVDVMFKIVRRVGFVPGFADLFMMCLHNKWARIGDTEMVLAILHGTVATGGRGVPMADGSLYELEGVSIKAPRRSQVEMVNLPTDAAIVTAREMRSDALKYVAGHEVYNADQIAKRSVEATFKGAIGQAQGIRAAQIAIPDDKEYYSQVPVIKQQLVQPKVYDDRFNFRKMLDAHRIQLRNMKRASARYAALQEAVVGESREKLLRNICLEENADAVVVSDHENLELYGFARVVLTEDYYDDVTWLAVILGQDREDRKSVV